MDALAIIGIVSNVLQMISFVHEVSSTCARLKEAGAPYPNLSENTEKLNSLAQKLQTSLQPTGQTPLPPDQIELRSLATECLKAGCYGPGRGDLEGRKKTGQDVRTRQKRRHGGARATAGQRAWRRTGHAR